jgi:hypothetical protein
VYEIDRIIVVLKPNQPFLNWVNTHKEDDEDDINLEELRQDSTALLVPIFDTRAEVEEYIESIYQDLFETELCAWTLDEETWPQPTSYNLFKEWFELEIHSLVLDTVEYDSSAEHPEDTATTIQ